MANAIAPIIAGVSGLAQMNQARNAQNQAQGYNQLLANQAMQQRQMFQNTLPAYNHVLDYYSRRANMGSYSPDNNFTQYENPASTSQQFKPFEIGGEKYHGLGSRLKGKGDGDAYRMKGMGDANGIGGRINRQQNVLQPPPGTGMQAPAGPTPATPNAAGLAGWGSRRTAGTPLPGPANLNRTGGVSDQQLGIWNNPEDRLRMSQAQDDIDRYQGLQNKQLLHQLAQRGLAESNVYGSGLENIAENALGQFANFRRNLAIGAGAEEDRRVAQFLNALSPGMGFAPQAAQSFGQLGAGQQQQAAQAQQALANLFQTFGQLFGPQPGAPGSNGWFSGTQNRGGGYNGGLGGF